MFKEKKRFGKNFFREDYLRPTITFKQTLYSIFFIDPYQKTAITNKSNINTY